MTPSQKSQFSHIHRVAIVDDNITDRAFKETEVYYAGFEPIPISESFKKLEDLIAFIQSRAEAAVCAHRFAHSGFFGAEVVAALYDLKFPAVLITRYAGIDDDVSIRRWREKVPVVLSSDEAYAQNIQDALARCVSELRDGLRPRRKLYRTLIRITHVTSESDEPVVDVIVPGWNPWRAVRFPVSLIPEDLHDKVEPKAAFFVKVNIGAEKAEDLCFKEFELAEEPDPDDGLA